MEVADPVVVAPESDQSASRRVVYLLGAGATQGAIDFAGSSASLIMSGLTNRLLGGMHEEYMKNFTGHPGMKRLVNDVVNTSTDFEHLLTFLDDTPSLPYRQFAAALETVFSAVLRAELEAVTQDLDGRHSALYAALVDMHQVEGAGESLAGFLTMNYDSFLEHAIEEKIGRGVDYGVQVQNGDNAKDPIPVLKLHGSFSWRHTWPLERTEEMAAGRWIPPGIRKAKAEYPFNAIWGAARELLDCDVLRVIGCNLGPNDWDLVSLLFSTMHGREAAGPYEVEVIGRPRTASRIAQEFPYLKPRSLLEVDGVGRQFIAEVLGREPTDFFDLDEPDQRTAIEHANSNIVNPFEHWLRLKGELMLRDLSSIETPRGLFTGFVEASS